MEKQAADKSPVDHQGNNRSFFPIVVSSLAIASMMVLTVAWLALIGLGISALFDWIAG